MQEPTIKENVMKFFKRNKKQAPVTEVATQKPVYGITDAEYREIRNMLCAEYAAAHLRQARPDMQPNLYMRGLDFAMEVLNKIVPHEIK